MMMNGGAIVSLLFCAAYFNLKCGQAVPPADITLVTASDACGTPTVTFVGDQSVINGCSETITRTYRAIDGCGNTATCAQTIIRNGDATPPVISCPANITLQCGQAVPPADITLVTASDACGTPTAVSYTH